MTEPIEVKQKEAVDIDGLLDTGKSAVVTLVAGETRLAAHRAVLAARSPVFQAMFGHDTLEASTGEVSIPDVEGAVLRQLLAHCYTLRAPQLPAVASQLLVAADKYGLLALKSACERQVAAQLTDENAAASAALAVRHSCPLLTKAAVAFIRQHCSQVMATQGWEDAMIKQPQDLIEVSRLLAETSTKIRIRSETPVMEIQQAKAVDLGALLDAGADAMVTLAAGQTQLVAHRAVLAARSPVLKAMFHDNRLESDSGQVTFPDTEGPVLRKLLAYCYTSQVPEPLHMAPQLLVAANTYGLPCLKTACERQVAAELTVSNAARAAVLAVRHSCPDLTAAAVAFIKDNLVHVVGTQGWADVMRNQTEDLVTVSRMLAEPPAEIKSLSAEEKGTRLIEAAGKGAVEELEALLAAGADVKALGIWRRTALHYAAAEGHKEVARLLLVAGAAVGAVDKWGQTALHWAAGRGLKAAGWMLRVTETEWSSRGQRTPLHCAEDEGHVAVVQLLLASGADFRVADVAGWTPLHWAAANGHTEAVAALLEAGAEREALDNEGSTPLDKARLCRCRRVEELLQC